MFENMTGAVGFAMHEDRLAKAAKNLRLADAERRQQGSREAVQKRYRAGIAAVLVGLAARIAPAITISGEQARMTSR